MASFQTDDRRCQHVYGTYAYRALDATDVEPICIT
jgi:hypothetical protein